MSRFDRIVTPGSIGELIERMAAGGPLGDFELKGAVAPSEFISGASLPIEWLARDLVVGTPTAGGNTVATKPPTIETALRGFSVAVDAGATVMTVADGTAGAVATTASPVASWVDENTADTASEPAFGAPVLLSPATLRVTAVISRKLLKSSPAAEAAVRAELLTAIGRAIDVAALGAGGGAAPTGIAGTSGRITQSGTTLSFATIADVERQLLDAGCRVENLRYIGTPTVREVLSTRERAAGSGMIVESDKIGSIPLHATADAPTGALFVGDWRWLQVVFYGERPRVFANPYRYSTSGSIELSIHCEVAIAVVRPGLFAHFDSVS